MGLADSSSGNSAMHYGLRHRPASMYLTMYFMTGPPALSGFPCRHNQASALRRLRSLCASCRGSPASSGFPVLCDTASGIDRPPSVLHSTFITRAPALWAFPSTRDKAMSIPFPCCFQVKGGLVPCSGPRLHFCLCLRYGRRCGRSLLRRGGASD